ncbi:MAG: hypothetical protein ACE145_17690 [Terriglobia bacterium]
MALVISAVAIANLYFFYSRGLINLYGDAMSHMEGARRFFDSLTPGYQEIGTVWLPLTHLLAAPLATNDFLWKTGLAGGIISTVAFALAAWLLFLLGFRMSRSLAAAVLALAGFLLCPNMLYLASTPLTEPLAILWMVLTVYGLFRYQETGRVRILVAAGVAAFCGTLTRYDGWALLPFEVLMVWFSSPQGWRRRIRHAALFSLIAGAGPLLWLFHNSYQFGNPLEFYNGPGSTQAQYAHQLATTAFRYPTDGNLRVAARYFLEDLKLVIGVWPLALALLGLIVWAVDRRERSRRSAALIFLVPLAFNVQGIAHSAVPLYVPTLFPNTYYNLRLGMELLPAAAILPSFLLPSSVPARLRWTLAAILLALILGQAIQIASPGAAELAVAKEGVVNTPCRSEKQQAVIRALKGGYDGQNLLMATGKWPCVMIGVGIPLRKTLSATNRTYRDRLRRDPGKLVEWIIRSDGDEVDDLMKAYPESFSGFALVFKGRFPGEGNVAIYRRHEP